VFTFFRGVTSDKIYFSHSSDGSTWSGGNTELGNGAQTSDDPAAVVFNGKIFLLYRGKGADDRVYVSQSTDGFSWTGNIPISTVGDGYDTRSPVAVTTDGINMYLAVRLRYGDGIRLFRSNDGFNWVYLIQPPYLSSRAVSICHLGGNINIVAKSTGSATGIYHYWYNISSGTVSGSQFISAFTNERPSLATDGSKLVVVYKGASTDNIYRSYSLNGGLTWQGNNQVAGQTNRGPAVLFTR
jgi:hypothetical protein